jgi:uncharacterized membrane protein YdjX (TVP38/TMEM64 family)
MRTLVLIATIGRFPGTLVANMIGSGIDDDISMKAWIFIGTAILLIGLAIYHKKKLESHAYNLIKPKKKR